MSAYRQPSTRLEWIIPSWEVVPNITTSPISMYKVSQNHIYYNENLFRTIDLRWVIYIRILFLHDFATLQPFPQNHIQDLASKTQNLKNSIFRAMTFKIFLEINIGLKSCQRYELSIPNNAFSIRHILRSIFRFFEKKCISVQFCGKMHVEHSGYHRGVRWTDIKKLILQPFRSVKIDAFSYSSH